MKTRKKTARKPKPKIRPLKATQVGERIRFLREAQGLSQGDIERATGLLRCYTSRVEHGHTLPSLETLERFASALGVPLYMMFCTGGESVLLHTDPSRGAGARSGRGREKAKAAEAIFAQMRGLLGRIAEDDREVLVDLAEELASRATGAMSKGKSRRRQ
jgi:transcriptional regulator with XRE-family HTH domain